MPDPPGGVGPLEGIRREAETKVKQLLDTLIENYGAVAVLAGAALEGETAAFLGGVFAHRHLIPYWHAAAAAALGSFLADQFFFLAGRRAAQVGFVRRAAASQAMTRVTGLLEAHPVGFILAFRFVYGIRTISPVAIGLSRIPATRFLLLNALAAVAWGVGVTAVGFVFGNAVEALFGRLDLHIHVLLAILVAIGLAIAAAVLSRKFMRR